jgi:hypothetical protein
LQSRVYGDSVPVVELQVHSDLLSRFGQCLVHLLRLHPLAQSLHKHVVPAAALAIHPDADLVDFEEPGEGAAGGLIALICVQNHQRAAACQSFLHRQQAECRARSYGNSPCQCRPAEINHRRGLVWAVSSWALKRQANPVCRASPLMASITIFALKAGQWSRLAPLAIFLFFVMTGIIMPDRRKESTHPHCSGSRVLLSRQAIPLDCTNRTGRQRAARVENFGWVQCLGVVLRYSNRDAAATCRLRNSGSP